MGQLINNVTKFEFGKQILTLQSISNPHLTVDTITEIHFNFPPPNTNRCIHIIIHVTLKRTKSHEYMLLFELCYFLLQSLNICFIINYENL